VRYEGFFVGGLPEGRGTSTQPNGDYFEGNWSSGLPLAGVGRMTSNSSSESKGGGALVVESQWEYNGGLKSFKWHGKGKLWWYVGAGSNKKILWSYDGEFVNGKKTRHRRAKPFTRGLDV